MRKIESPFGRLALAALSAAFAVAATALGASAFATDPSRAPLAATTSSGFVEGAAMRMAAADADAGGGAARTDAATADARIAALRAEINGLDYQRARYHPIHFPPRINAATNGECLVCHQEILDHAPRDAAPAGVPADQTIAWYQTLDTYAGAQASFHWRHLKSDFATSVMALECVFCHKGSDPREESPDMMPGRAPFGAGATPEFTLRKMVNPSTTCLRCHGAMPDVDAIMGIGAPWPEARVDFEDEETPNGCLACHADIRTNRHNVDYLKPEAIEAAARAGSSDSCYGCHGGRQWYRISYPYPRHAWPDMDEEIPEWAIGRPTESDPAHQRPQAATE